MPDRDPALFSRENTASRASYDFPFSRISSGYEIMIHDNNKNYIHMLTYLSEHLSFTIFYFILLYVIYYYYMFL